MALQRTGIPGATAASAVQAPPAATISAGPALSTRDTMNRPFLELGVMFGQALGGREPVMQALTNLQNIGGEHGCDAIIAIRLLHYPTSAGPAVVAYGTGVRFLPMPEGGAADGQPVDTGAMDGMAGAAVAGAAAGGMPAGTVLPPGAAGTLGSTAGTVGGMGSGVSAGTSGAGGAAGAQGAGQAGR
ncbi:MAG: hypothetical protein AVDCRST_MAG77-3856 [uncultured Chloroflexi bacterium]|uniref:Uncharacterized protein n=1 Tax=uncultured Chloroflexota bacterium TaxID=166587 RepID=A0A6J4JKW7_9CHLR|nr:MAG: hypothetical protein AVDCRST_MAG77-3856 [uncultured Chloroflexota bacterium]